jgi:hypothetical protein
VEQRIEPNIQPQFAVTTDPAYIPGLTAPRPAGREETVGGEQTEEREPDGAVPQDEPQDEPRDAPEEALTEGVPDDGAVLDEEAAAGETEKEAGPVFEVSDRRGSITADRDGIRFRLDDEEAEFRWDELGAVEVKCARFGRRFTVTVHLSTRRWFDAEVEAATRSRLKEWTAELDAVLDAYFEGS